MIQISSQFVNMPQYLITWGMFFGAGLLTFFIQIFRNSKNFALSEMIRHCVPFNVWNSKSFHMDVIIYVVRKFTDFIFVVPGLALMAAVAGITSLAIQSLFPAITPLPANLLVTSICTVAMFLAAEFADYLMHYLEHKIPALWELHKVHHSADFLNPLTSKRGHSLPIFYGGVVAGVLTGLVAGLLMATTSITLAEVIVLKLVASKLFTLGTLDPLKHSHIPIGFGWFEKILISPHMHQVHHSKCEPHWDKNFGTNLSIFDWIFGTAYRPVKDEKIVYGISGYSESELGKFNTLKGAYISPVLASGKKLNEKLRPFYSRGRLHPHQQLDPLVSVTLMNSSENTSKG